MNVAPEVLADRLSTAEVGTVHSDRARLSGYRIDGKSPSLRCTPATAAQIGTILRTCAEVGATVVPWGGGTAIALGNIPQHVDLVIDMTQLDQLVEHDAANLTATVQAGMKLAALQEILGRQQQFLAFDPPHPIRATIGGVVAANTNGPRRMLYGGVRDLIIGMKMVLATGEQIKAGGKVVKNVAGYDMCKLFVGSLGTLGIITEVTAKMTPLPETTATIVAQGPGPHGLRLIDELFASTLLPAGIVLLSPGLAQGSGLPAETTVVVRAEGFEEAVARHTREVRALAERLQLGVQVLGEEAQRALWERVRDFGTDEARVIIRLTVPLGSVGAVVMALDQWDPPLRGVHYVVHAGTGTVWVSLDAESASAASFLGLFALAKERGGHAVMTAAPPALKEGIDVWGPAPPSLALMREIKRQFDPQGILNPGRFIAGI